MVTGRPTADPKGEDIRVRLNWEMKQFLFQKSQKEKKSISQIIRELIRDEMRKQ